MVVFVSVQFKKKFTCCYFTATFVHMISEKWSEQPSKPSERETTLLTYPDWITRYLGYCDQNTCLYV